MVALIAITAFETVCNVAGVGAVFPSGVAVCREGLTAVCTSEVVHGFAVDLFWVGVPPGNTAFVGAELDAFPAWGLREQCTALQAEVGIQVDTAVVGGLCAGQPYLSAVCDNGIFLQSHCLCDGGISAAL